MTTVAIEDLVLSEDQQTALDAVCDFIVAPNQPVFIFSGYAGTGKSTLVARLLDHIPKFLQTIKLLDNEFEALPIELTATTNKACEALSAITGQSVVTIHSLLGIKVKQDGKGGTYLDDFKAKKQYDKIIVIDEASYIDKQVLGMIFEHTIGCKIIFMGDSAQLTAVKSNNAPVFDLKGYPRASLTQVVRQAEGNPIIELATLFRHAVNTGEFPEDVTYLLDGKAIQHMDRDEFNATVQEEFTRPDWKFSQSKVLAWTNKRVVEYNNFIREHVKGEPELEVHDYAVVNAFCMINGSSLKTDQMVEITAIENGSDYDTPGKWYEINGQEKFFMPNSLAERKEAIKRAKQADDGQMMFAVKQNWIDLRALYACTVNKSQGSTYDKAYIDLDDIAACNNKNQVARMLYVAFSRARHELILTGDLR